MESPGAIEQSRRGAQRRRIRAAPLARSAITMIDAISVAMTMPRIRVRGAASIEIALVPTI